MTFLVSNKENSLILIHNSIEKSQLKNYLGIWRQVKQIEYAHPSLGHKY